MTGALEIQSDDYRSLRPLKLGELLDRSLFYFARQLPHLLGLLVLVALIEQVLAQLPTGFSFGKFGLLLVTWILPFVLTGVIVRMTTMSCFGQALSLRAALKSLSIRKVMGVVALSIWILCVTILGLVCFLVPGIVYSVNRLLAIPVYLIEGGTMREALWRSRFLMTRGRWYSVTSPMMRASVVMFVVFVLVSSLSIGEEARDHFAWGAGHAGWGALVLGVTFGVFTQILTHVGSVLYTLFYLDLRSRFEGLDLYLQLDLLESEPGATV